MHNQERQSVSMEGMNLPNKGIYLYRAIFAESALCLLYTSDNCSGINCDPTIAFCSHLSSWESGTSAPLMDIIKL